MFRILCLLFISIFINDSNGAGLFVESPSELAGSYLSSSMDPYFYLYNVSGRILNVKHVCQGVSAQDKQDIESNEEEIIAMTFASIGNICAFDVIQRNLGSINNVIAIIYVLSDGEVGSGQKLARETPIKGTPLPIIDLSLYEGNRILNVLNSDTPVIATITTPTTNPYNETIDSAGGITIRVLIGVWSVVLGIFATVNLYRMKNRRGLFKVRLPEVSMLFEILVDIIRILYIIDPGAQYTPITYVACLVFLQYFIIQIVLLAVLLYWQKALCKSTMRPATWTAAKRAGISILVIWILLLISVLVLLAFNTLLAVVIFIIEVLTAQIIVVGLVLSSLRILRVLTRNPDTKLASKEKLTRIGKLVALSILTTIAYVVLIIVSATNATSKTPGQKLLLNSFVFFLLCVSSTSLVVVFAPTKSSGVSGMSSETFDKLSYSSATLGKLGSEVELQSSSSV